MFEKGLYLYIFYCLCFVEDISENMEEKKLMEETDSDLEGQDYFSVPGDREEHW